MVNRQRERPDRLEAVCGLDGEEATTTITRRGVLAASAAGVPGFLSGAHDREVRAVRSTPRSTLLDRTRWRSQPTADEWSQRAILTADDATPKARFGYSIAIDGDRALVGADTDDENGADAGAAYIFELDEKGGQTVLSLSKLADIPIELHRPLPDDVHKSNGSCAAHQKSPISEDATIKEVTLKKEKTGEWFAIFGIERDRGPPAKPENPEQCVGIDVGILKYAHDTDGCAVGPLDLSDERERLEREQRTLSRKDHGSNNWEKQRQRVAECHLRIKRKRRDFLHKLSAYYAREYDLVAVEDLDVKEMLESPKNSRNMASAAWHTFRRMLEYKCEPEGTHFAAVEPEGTTK